MPLDERRDDTAGATARAPSARADLSENSDLLLALIDSPLQWRSRLVEELAFQTGAHVRVTSSYQIDFPPDLVREHVDTSVFASANVLIPLTTREKRPLLNLDIAGPAGAPVHLLSRASIAGLETQYLTRLIETSPASEALKSGMSGGLLEAICVFTPDYFNSLLDVDDDEAAALLRYLRSGLGEAAGVTADAVAEWREATREVASVLAPYAAWLPAGASSAEEVLLAMPRVDPLPRTRDEVTKIVQGFRAAVVAAAEVCDEVLLRALAEYGRRYELIVEVEVPLLEPSTIKVGEDRPLGERSGGWVRQPFRLGDAQSAHLEARVLDPNVVIDKFAVHGLDKHPVALGPLESARQTDETLALYSSEVDRPDYAYVSLLLRPRRHLRLTAGALMTLNIIAASVALAMPHDSLLIERLSLLTVPTTLATAFALIREQTSLAAHLQRTSRIGLATTTAVLWVVVLVLVMTFHPKPAKDFSQSPGHARPKAPVSAGDRAMLEHRKESSGTQRSTR